MKKNILYLSVFVTAILFSCKSNSTEETQTTQEDLVEGTKTETVETDVTETVTETQAPEKEKVVERKKETKKEYTQETTPTTKKEGNFSGLKDSKALKEIEQKQEEVKENSAKKSESGVRSLKDKLEPKGE